MIVYISSKTLIIELVTFDFFPRTVPVLEQQGQLKKKLNKLGFENKKLIEMMEHNFSSYVLICTSEYFKQRGPRHSLFEPTHFSKNKSTET